MSSEKASISWAEVLFEAKDIDPETKAIAEAIGSRAKMGYLLGEKLGITDLRKVIMEFMKRIESERDKNGEWRFSVIDENGMEIGTPKDMGEDISGKIYEAVLKEINMLYEACCPVEKSILEFLEEIESIDVCIEDGEVTDIFI